MIENAVDYFGLLPVVLMGLLLVMMAVLAFGMSVLAED